MSCGTDEHGKVVLYAPMKAIRRKCLDCCLGSANEVKLCVSKTCSLYPYRFGKDPRRKPRVYTEEQKEILVKRLQGGRVKSPPKGSGS